MLSDYTTYDSVRAVLGVSSRVFPDAVMATEIYELALRADLIQVGQGVSETADLDADYLALIDESMSLATAAQNFYNAVRLFSAHSAAFKALAAMPELSPTFISDSKASLRKDKSAVTSIVTGDYAKYRRHLAVMYAAFLDVAAPASFQPNLMGLSIPDFDPVTGA
jgi:hypothetical protein